ncbi:MAG: patatin family protein [Lachnospiraceae bacterium]|nr:patatin family protein [Lachnospiraceae bacterium]
MKYGLVLEGGGMRGLFTMGILDVWMEQGDITVDGAVGVSAGAAFGCNFKSGQIGRGIRYNVRYAKDWHYKSYLSWLLTGDIFGAKFCYETLPRELDVFDTEAFANNPMEFYAAVTNIETGKAMFKRLHDGGDRDMQWIRASASLPVVSRIVKIGRYKLLDGGIADSIPLHFMEGRGYDRNIVILTQPEGFVKEKNSMLPLVKVALRKYPKAVEAMENRHIMYNRETAYVAEREAAGAAYVIRPDEPLAISNMETSGEELMRVYNHGRDVGKRTLEEVRRFLAGEKIGSDAPEEGI